MQNRVLDKCGSLMMQLPLEDWQLTLHQWWQLVTMVGPDFGYYPNASKTHLVAKPELVNKAKRMLYRYQPMARHIWVLP